jgi:hypothetical protein
MVLGLTATSSACKFGAVGDVNPDATSTYNSVGRLPANLVGWRQDRNDGHRIDKPFRQCRPVEPIYWWRVICTASAVLMPRPSTLAAVALLGGLFGLPVPAHAAQLAMTWADNSVDEEGFLIERRPATGSFVQISVVGPNVVSYLDASVASGGSYCYRVRAFNGVGMSAYTNEACGTAVGPSTSPLSVTLNQAAFSRSDTLVTTVTAVGGLVPTSVDAYIVLEIAGGGFLSLQLNGSLVPGLVPIARNLVLPSVTAPFAFPLAGAPPGSYRWLAAVTTPGTLSLVSPLVSTPFTIAP